METRKSVVPREYENEKESEETANGHRISFEDDEHVLELDSGNSCRTL